MPVRVLLLRLLLLHVFTLIPLQLWLPMNNYTLYYYNTVDTVTTDTDTTTSNTNYLIITNWYF